MTRKVSLLFLIFFIILSASKTFADNIIRTITTTTDNNGTSTIYFPNYQNPGIFLTTSSGNYSYANILNGLSITTPDLFLNNTLHLVSNSNSIANLYTNITQNEYVYVITDAGYTLSKYDVANYNSTAISPTWQKSGFSAYLVDVVVGNDGYIYLLNANAYVVYQLDTNGNTIKTISTSSNYAYIISGNGSIWIYHNNLPIKNITSSCNTGTFSSGVWQLAFDNNGHEYAALNNGSIQQFTGCTIGYTYTTGASALYGIAISADGSIWVSAYYSTGPNWKILHFDNSGNLLGSYPNGSNNMYQIMFDGSGILWIEGSNYIYSFNPNTGTFTPYSATSTGQNNRGSVKSDALGNVWIPSGSGYVYMCNSKNETNSVQQILLNNATNGIGVAPQYFSSGIKVGYNMTNISGGQEYSLNSTNTIMYFDLLANLANIWSPSPMNIYSSSNPIGLWGSSFTLSDFNGNFITSDTNSIKIGYKNNYIKTANTGVGITSASSSITVTSSGITETGLLWKVNSPNSLNKVHVDNIQVAITGSTITESASNSITNTITSGILSSLSFSGTNGVVSNGVLANYGGPVTGSTLTQSAIFGSVSGVNGTGSFSLAGLPFTNFWATGYSGYDFIFDPVLWMGSVGNWINYPLPGWNTTTGSGRINAQGYWLTYDPLNKLAPIFGSPYGGYIETFILPNSNQDYQRYVGAVGATFLQEIANQDYFQLKTPNGTLQIGSAAYGGFTMTTDNSNFGIYYNSVGTWFTGTNLNINSPNPISLNSPVTSNVSGVDLTFTSGGYVGSDNGLHMGSSITTSSVGIYNNSTGSLNPGFAEDYGPVTLTNGCTTVILQYPFPTNHYNCTFNYLSWDVVIGIPTFTFTTNQFTVCSRSSTGVINTTDANTITGTCTGY